MKIACLCVLKLNNRSKSSHSFVFKFGKGVWKNTVFVFVPNHQEMMDDGNQIQINLFDA